MVFNLLGPAERHSVYNDRKKANRLLVYGTVCLGVAILVGKIKGEVDVTVSLASLLAFIFYCVALLHYMNTTFTSNKEAEGVQRNFINVIWETPLYYRLFASFFLGLSLVFGFLSESLGFMLVGGVGLTLLWGEIIFKKFSSRAKQKLSLSETIEETIEKAPSKSVIHPDRSWYNPNRKVAASGFF